MYYYLQSYNFLVIFCIRKEKYFSLISIFDEIIFFKKWSKKKSNYHFYCEQNSTKQYFFFFVMQKTEKLFTVYRSLFLAQWEIFTNFDITPFKKNNLRVKIGEKMYLPHCALPGAHQIIILISISTHFSFCIFPNGQPL